VTQIDAIRLQRLAEEFRFQRIVFEAACEVYDQMQAGWQGSREHLLAQVVRLVEPFIRSDKVTIVPAVLNEDELSRRLMLTLNMTRVVQHIWEAIRFENAEALAPVFDRDRPIRSTGDMAPWYTARPCEYTKRSHINFCVYDGTWEACDAFALDHHPAVAAWVKNDHLGFEILYVYRGVVRKYRPDFIVKLADGTHLILETKGEASDQDRAKWVFAREWVAAVNEHGGFGRWEADVSFAPGDVADVLGGHG